MTTYVIQGPEKVDIHWAASALTTKFPNREEWGVATVPENATKDEIEIKTPGFIYYSDQLEQVECSGRPKIFVGIPSLGKTSLLWVESACLLNRPREYDLQVGLVVGKKVAEAREELVVRAIESGAEYLLFYGDDMLPPQNALNELIGYLSVPQVASRGAVGAAYMVRRDIPPLVCAWRNDKFLRPQDLKNGSLLEVSGQGLDFCLIKIDMLKKLSTPRFKESDGGRIESEDSFFWRKYKRETRKMGLLAAGLRVGHYDAAERKIY